MNTLNLGSDDEPVVKKKSNTRYLKIALGLAAVILIPTIGSTLAGSIAVGTGSVEFGQGVLTTAACDATITVTPTSALVTGSNYFRIATVAVTDIDNANCSGKKFTIKALKADGTIHIIGSGTNNYCRVNFVSTGSTTIDFGGCTVAGAINGFTLTPGQTLAAEFIDVITVESS